MRSLATSCWHAARRLHTGRTAEAAPSSVAVGRSTRVAGRLARAVGRPGCSAVGLSIRVVLRWGEGRRLSMSCYTS
jgi:hypothetical protein